MPAENITIIKGFVTQSTAEDNRDLNLFLETDGINFLTLYFDLRNHPDTGELSNFKSLHFLNSPDVFQKLGEGPDDNTQISDCLFFSDAEFYFREKKEDGEFKKGVFSIIQDVPDFIKEAIKSTISLRVGHSSTRHIAND